MSESIPFSEELPALIESTYERIRSDLSRTPLERSMALSLTNRGMVLLKHEEMQLTGSFKLRGALSKLSRLPSTELSRGVVTASTGNHGLAVSFAAKRFGTEATVLLPRDTHPQKIEKIRDLGATVLEIPGDCLASETAARAYSEKRGLPFISPYNDLHVIVGQGTFGLEIFEQTGNAPLDAIFVTVGGGGLISGIAGYLRKKRPQTRIYGCWPENSRAMYECIQAGRIISVDETPTLSVSSSGGVEPGSLTFEPCRSWIDEAVLVSENEIREAMKLIADTEHCMIEGAAGVAVAGFLKSAPKLQGKNVAIVLCGRNISLADFRRIIS